MNNHVRDPKGDPLENYRDVIMKIGEEPPSDYDDIAGCNEGIIWANDPRLGPGEAEGW